MIKFNEPVVTGNEIVYINDVISRKQLSGNYSFTKKCQSFLEERYNVPKALLTTSCTDALEMASILIGIQPGDEVIMPSYTFVSTANAFVLRGATIKFIDSMSTHPNMDCNLIENEITEKTKAIIVVHYAGVSVDMDKVKELANKYKLFVIEDAAQAIESTYTMSNGLIKQLGTIGDLGTFSFHETKNITSGEGGALLINNADFLERAEIIWEKGTNRASFSRGEINKYGWVDIGSSFLPSELNAAYLWAQLEKIDEIATKRKEVHLLYSKMIEELELNKDFIFPKPIPKTSNNGHIFFLITNSKNERTKLIQYLSDNNIKAVFHYLALHQSSFFKNYGLKSNNSFKNAIKFENCLLRLPMFNELTPKHISKIVATLKKFKNSELQG